MKTCNKCGKTKDFTKFYRREKSLDGFSDFCIACYMRAYKLKTTDHKIVDKFYTVLDIKREIKNQGVKQVAWQTGYPESMIRSWLDNRYAITEIQGEKLRRVLFKVRKVVKVI